MTQTQRRKMSCRIMMVKEAIPSDQLPEMDWHVRNKLKAQNPFKTRMTGYFKEVHITNGEGQSDHILFLSGAETMDQLENLKVSVDTSKQIMFGIHLPRASKHLAPLTIEG